MAYWLFKEEPGCYRFEELERDGHTVWSGVSNNLARKNLRSVCKGDSVFFYATGTVKAVLGKMKVISEPHSDPESQDPRAVVVEVQAAGRLKSPVTLAAIKRDKQLADWDLVRLSRLSVMPVSPGQWNRVLELSRETEESRPSQRSNRLAKKG